MKLLRLIGLIFFEVGLVLLFVLGYFEFLNNFNYYFHHQVNFILLISFGILFFSSGLWLMNWETEEKKQVPSMNAFA